MQQPDNNDDCNKTLSAALELVPNGVAANRDELLGYGLSEEIVHYKRRWFVVREFADDVLSRLLAQRKPIKDLTNGDETQSV